MNLNKRARDVQQDAEHDDAIGQSESTCQTKRSRILSTGSGQPPSISLPAVIPLPSSSTSIGQSFDPPPDVPLTLIASTLQLLADAAAAAVNDSESIHSRPSPALMDRVVSLASQQRATPETSGNNGSFGGEGISQAELQSQLVTTWDTKRVQELESQGEWLPRNVC
jgi:hypothetical protein